MKTIITILLSFVILNCDGQSNIPDNLEKLKVNYRYAKDTFCKDTNEICFLVELYDTNFPMIFDANCKEIKCSSYLIEIGDSFISCSNLNCIENNYPVFFKLPESINYFPLDTTHSGLVVIDNRGRIADFSYYNVKPMPNLRILEIGMVTNQLTQIPQIIYSPNLEQFDIGYLGENFRILKNIIKHSKKNRNLNYILINYHSYNELNSFQRFYFRNRFLIQRLILKSCKIVLEVVFSPNFNL